VTPPYACHWNHHLAITFTTTFAITFTTSIVIHHFTNYRFPAFKR
jgi:hypothetical protein